MSIAEVALNVYLEHNLDWWKQSNVIHSKWQLLNVKVEQKVTEII